MLLPLETVDRPMKVVYQLADELARNPEHVELVQALTLNTAKPLLGLRGKHGLFGSKEWWESIRRRRIRTEVRSGVIERTYFAGQDSRRGDRVNSVTLRLDDGSALDEGIYATEKQDAHLFVPGARVLIAYALDELKQQPAPNGDANYSRIVLEVAISTEEGSGRAGG
jgi:hypothetical protein